MRGLSGLLCAVALAAAASAGWAAEEAIGPDPPPTYPKTKRVFSATPSRGEIKLLQYLFVRGKGLRRIIKYVASTPGQPRVQVFKYREEPAPTPEQVHAFYTEWARQAGFRPLVAVRMGRPPIDPMLDDWDRPYRPEPERPPAPWEEEEYTWVDAFHRPGDAGGVFISVWTKFQHVWVWKPGHCPVAPILGEWLGLPRVEADMTPPAEVLPFPEPPGFPPVAETGFYVRAQVGKWEIDSLSRDLQARVLSKQERRGPLDALFSVAPATFGPVRHAWLVNFRDFPPAREACVQPWVEWATRRGWAPLPITASGPARVRAWYSPGATGGAMVLFDVRDTTNVLVFDGPPNLIALLPVLDQFQQPIEEPRPHAEVAAPTRSVEEAGHVGAALAR